MADAPSSINGEMPPSQTNDSPARGNHSKWHFGLLAASLLALMGGILAGLLSAYLLDYRLFVKGFSELVKSKYVSTRVYADDGETVIAEFTPLKRSISIKYEEIPPVLKNALLVEGESKLVRYLARLLIPSSEPSFKSRINEWLISLQIKRFYTKQQILEIYANQIFFGDDMYGVELAAETYFGKQAKDLTLEEAALLTGMLDDPNEYSPHVNPQAAKERRNEILDSMMLNGFVSSADAEVAKAKPLMLADTAATYNSPRSSPYDYPVEEIRKYLEDKYGTEAIESGLKVYTTINVESQKKATEVLRAGLRQYDAGRGEWRSKYDNIAEGELTQSQLDNYQHPDWYGNDYHVGEYLTGLVMEVNQAKNEATVRFGNFMAVVGPNQMGRSGREPNAEFKPGLLAEFVVKEVDENNRHLKVELSQIPDVQGAMITINAQSGEIVTMVGGYDSQTSETNFATAAWGTTGSAYQPFIYTAAIEWGMTPDSTVRGESISIGDWTPRNYDGSTGNGDLPLKIALAKSLNIPAVHLLQTVGIQTGAQMVRRFGITVPMAPYLSSALGSDAVPLDEMVSAYSAFPNKGVRVQPHMIRRVLDRDGNVLEEWEKTTYKVTSEYVALTMVDMMRGVIETGTATGAKVLGVPLAGMTGTVENNVDVWFIGYAPTYVTGVWMGYPSRKKPLGNDMTGDKGAMPIFVEFMKDFLKDKEKENFPNPPAMPDDMKELKKQREREVAEENIDMPTGRRAAAKRNEGSSSAITNPKLEQVTVPPMNPDERTDSLPPPSTTRRPREVEPQKKKGKKGPEEP